MAKASARKAAARQGAAAPPADETALDLFDRMRWGALVILAVAGMGVAAYLTYTYWADEVVACGGVGQCEEVQQSEYSAIAGVPVSLLGGLAAMALLGIALGRLVGLPLAVEWASLAALGLTTASVAFAAYLTYIELFVLEAICLHCMALASIFTASWLISLSDTFLTRDISPEPG
jgi:uncharacterized membrane protein